MAGAQVGITVEDADVQEAIRTLARNLVSLRQPLDEIGAMAVTSTQQRFEREVDPEGQPWPELAQSTRTKRVTRTRERGSANKLRVRGHLYNSITHEVAVLDREVKVGTNRVYAALQQFGGTPTMKNPGARAVPARPFLGLSHDDRKEIGRILMDHLGKGL